MDTIDVILIIAILFLICLSAFFSATETAFSSVNKIRLKNLASNGNKKAARALKMSENYDELLSTILVGNNIANILSSSLATVLFTRLIGNSGVTIATIVMTVLVLLFGEISPKSIAKEKAENLDRLKSAFLANMSHEIRTPLNAIVGFASLLVESDDKKERQDYVDIMQENTELLLQLISDILDLSKIEAGTLDFTMDHLDIKSFCEDIMRNYDIKEDKPVPVLLAPDLPEYYIYTDKKRLMQVITNFINNALKFTNEGQIMLEYRHKAESNEIEFAVTDTGMGIAPDKVDQVFDRFVKLNSFSKGTGLGLSICRSIIEHLGGTIGAESEIGVGSRFWFTHPLRLNQ